MTRDAQFAAVLLTTLSAEPVAGCAASPRPPVPTGRETLSKIKFDLAIIRPDGLCGQCGGLVSVAYRFCAPADERIYQDLRRIDATARIHPGVSAGVGCSPGAAACIVYAHQPHCREVLAARTALGSVRDIRECFFK